MSPFQVTPEWEEGSSNAQPQQQPPSDANEESTPVVEEAPPSIQTEASASASAVSSPKKSPVSTPKKSPKNSKSAVSTPSREKPNTTNSSGTTEEDPSLNDMLRKAGVAVAGGAMVGIGLVMIPLPTPCGALVAGSGLAVLGTEFEGARKIMDHTVEKVDETRVKLVEKIEKNLEKKDHEDDDDDDDSKKKKGEQVKRKQNSEATTLGEENKEKASATSSTPHMNEAERLRQEKLQQEQRDRFKGMYGVEQETVQETIDQTRRAFQKQTRLLGKTILPFLKRMDVHELRKEHLPSAKAESNTKAKEVVPV